MSNPSIGAHTWGHYIPHAHVTARHSFCARSYILRTNTRVFSNFRNPETTMTPQLCGLCGPLSLLLRNRCTTEVNAGNATTVAATQNSLTVLRLAGFKLRTKLAERGTVVVMGMVAVADRAYSICPVGPAGSSGGDGQRKLRLRRMSNDCVR